MIASGLKKTLGWKYQNKVSKCPHLTQSGHPKHRSNYIFRFIFMGPLTEELISTLDSLIEMLIGQNEMCWAKYMDDSRKEIKNSDFHGIEKILSAYGGMGSINDIPNPSGLISRVYELAYTIKKAQ